MHIFITGGTGLIGRAFIKAHPNDQFTCLVRHQSRRDLGEHCQYIESLDALTELNTFDGVLNLAGEPIIDKRWTNARKSQLCQSRWGITASLVKLIQASQSPPAWFLSGSAIGRYTPTELALDEDATTDIQATQNFPQQLCQRWEAEALNAETSTRVVLLRTGVVLATQGGALKKMLPAFRMGLGGPIGKGQQMMSWIDLTDMVRAIDFLISHNECRGAINMTAPTATSNATLSQHLGKILRRPTFLAVPTFVMRTLLGEASQLLLDSQTISPKRLLNAGFEFNYPDIEQCLKHQLG